MGWVLEIYEVLMLVGKKGTPVLSDRLYSMVMFDRNIRMLWIPGGRVIGVENR